MNTEQPSPHLVILKIWKFGPAFSSTTPPIPLIPKIP